ncbi:LAGLIDADG family homing endonuclease [Micromonospora sp. GCM10011542]|uniref:LAGLIDADG family homing endonuclease n=1 Tax=Micromonospora sp. GCM10011542 TaxID=3317337 RepID=UPI00360722D5
MHALEAKSEVGLALPGWQWRGRGNSDEGYLVGHFIGDGHFSGTTVHLDVWEAPGVEAVRQRLTAAASHLPHRADWAGFRKIERHGKQQMSGVSLLELMTEWGLFPGCKTVNDQIERGSSNFICGVISGLLDTDGHVEGKAAKGVTIRLSQANTDLLHRVQRMLGWLGIRSTVHAGRAAGARLMPDGHGGLRLYDTQGWSRLLVGSSDARRLTRIAGFVDTAKAAKYERLTEGMTTYRKSPVDKVKSVQPCTVQLVDVQLLSAARWLAVNGVAVDARTLQASRCERDSLARRAVTGRTTATYTSGSLDAESGDPEQRTMKEVGKLRQDGLSAVSIALRLHLTPARVRELLIKAGTPERARDRSADRLPASELSHAYELGKSVPELAAHYDVGEQHVRDALAAAGVDLRGAGRRGHTLKVWSLTKEQLAAEYAAAGLVELGRRYGVAAGTVKSALLRHGIERRPTGHRANPR